MRLVFLFALALSLQASIEPPAPRTDAVTVLLLKDTVATQAAVSTNLLPFELSAVRLRREESNRIGSIG